MATICARQGESLAERNLHFKGVIGSCSQEAPKVSTGPPGKIISIRPKSPWLAISSVPQPPSKSHVAKIGFQWASQAIVYDVWGMAISLPELDSKHRIRVPLLGINSEAFMYWPGNFNAAWAICEEVRQRGSLCWLMTAKGTVHISQSDFCILYPHTANTVLKKTTMEHTRAIDFDVGASHDFSSRVLPLKDMPFHRLKAGEEPARSSVPRWDADGARTSQEVDCSTSQDRT
jgi:platelet-activating factor acetylhydrolase